MNGICGMAVGDDRRGEKHAGGRTSPMRRLACFSVLLAFLGSAEALKAQDSVSRLPEVETQQPAGQSQQPGAGAQVRTGTSSGLDSDARLENLLADHQFLRIGLELGNLPPRQAEFYRGILANRDNNARKSIELLEPLADGVAASGDTVREILLRKALAEDYLREGDWAKAAQAYQILETRLGSKLSKDEQDEIEMPLLMLPLAKDNPPMTVDPCDPFEMQVSRNPLGLTDVPVFVDARPHSWMLDPTAPLNLISRSLAKEAGLKVSDDSVTIHTLTGRPIQVHVTVIPRFTIGGQLTLHDMTAFVFEDGDYFFPQTKYQVEGVLGYAALEALGSLTVTDNATIFIRPDKQTGAPEMGDKLESGVRFFLDGDQVIVALGGLQQESKAGEERMYAIDASGQQTYLTSRYYDEHSGDFSGQTLELFTIPGRPELRPVPAYTAETTPLAVGATTIQLHYLPVLTQPLGSAARDDVYGLLGVNALEQLESYTFDYRTMRFSVRQE